MKRIFLLMWFTLLSVSLYAQQEAEGRVGIGTSSPKATLDILENASLPEAQAQGVTFPNFSTDERAKFRDVKVGTMIFNTTKQCLEMYYGLKEGEHYWDCIRCDGNQQQAQDVRVEAAGFEGNYLDGVRATGENKVKFELINDSFSAITNIDLSRAVTIENGGSSLKVIGSQNQSISLNGGEKKVISWTLEGTPKTGEIKAIFDKSGLYAEQSMIIGRGTATFTNSTITKNVVSLSSTSISVQGYMDNGTYKVTIDIPYTNGKGNYDEVSVTRVSAPGQDGDENELTLKIPRGTFRGTGKLVATIGVSGDGSYKVKKMPADQSYTIATFPVNINGSHFTVELKGFGGWTSTQTQRYSAGFVKLTCGYGFVGNTMYYAKEATATATSAVSQADADQKARDKAQEEAKRLVDAEGQDYVNKNGSCRQSMYYYRGRARCAYFEGTGTRYGDYFTVSGSSYSYQGAESKCRQALENSCNNGVNSGTSDADCSVYYN
ncbi:DUF5977 domain-containing protein [Ornithobacterium rhinotracheale]|uniref:DUF5977 domain-containing protein n=2 Tax=Ornithobacterium rhinotracheale TaxID=28251 RepID=I3ZZP0_ORNRL|nr:hypothetical protein [Ornithobacterium rhinotracheale]AFL97174.1 hypothetical protein Ornrh_0982 [Ornithobacterium rhinotracheale DSM 15997]AIQ00482.1 hypothetical protein Q785_05505 [Ornithobacterium rhinotracheale ORT-UMN 88]KGB67461.1 hypothetical protein Q787_05390 [Ornithobacterium rhinotracheale H06-030791]MCK0194302.1 hypothetical protein [Ornithobacterium rhinotracheale]UOH64406.1 hypothetical protein MT993_04125 [Ornithobacterium rhinotracheale]